MASLCLQHSERSVRQGRGTPCIALRKQPPSRQHPCPGLGLQLRRGRGPRSRERGEAGAGSRGAQRSVCNVSTGVRVYFKQILSLINAVRRLRLPCWGAGRGGRVTSSEGAARRRASAARGRAAGGAGNRGRWAWFAGRARRLSSPGPPGARWDDRESGVGLPGPARQVRAGVGVRGFRGSVRRRDWRGGGGSGL